MNNDFQSKQQIKLKKFSFSKINKKEISDLNKNLISSCLITLAEKNVKKNKIEKSFKIDDDKVSKSRNLSQFKEGIISSLNSLNSIHSLNSKQSKVSVGSKFKCLKSGFNNTVNFKRNDFHNESYNDNRNHKTINMSIGNENLKHQIQVKPIDSEEVKFKIPIYKTKKKKNTEEHQVDKQNDKQKDSLITIQKTIHSVNSLEDDYELANNPNFTKIKKGLNEILTRTKRLFLIEKNQFFNKNFN